VPPENIAQGLRGEDSAANKRQMNANVFKVPLKKVDEDEPTSRRVIGCPFEVGEVSGPAFLESMYEKALCVELAECGP